MSEPKLLILGTQPFLFDPAPRLELHEFVASKNHKQYSLYIQALHEIYYNRDSENVASYFQIAGIHGVPYISWNQSPNPSYTNGYCVHGSPIFATWHRPYVVLFEQEIQKIAVKLAHKYLDEQADWIQAAQHLRQPYWAWDADKTITPPDKIIIKKEVEITKPHGKAIVQNPFYFYRFPSGKTEEYFIEPFNLRHVTLRWPNDNDNSHPEKLKIFLENPLVKSGIISAVKRVFSATEWDDFSAKLENIHGNIHDIVGGLGLASPVPDGHMSFIRYAGFDPIFWAHHAQVDRLLQKWYVKHGLWESSEKNLTPFWNTDSTYWSSPAITDPHATFNYSYPSMEVPSSNLLSHSWEVRINAKKFEVGGSFTVFIFLGKVPEKPQEWITDPSFAGFFSFFVNAEPELCKNCSEKSDAVVEDFVDLNPALEKVGLESLELQHVRRFLTEKANSEWVNFNWVISTANGDIIHHHELPTRFPSLRLLVGDTSGEKVPFGMIPQNYYPEITRGRPGGADSI